MTTPITIDTARFRELFPYFADISDESICAAYQGAGSYIATMPGVIGLDLATQTRGVYLATAHIAYLMKNPDKFRALSSASEGSVSASFAVPPTKDLFQYYLSLTPYGLELLAILSTIQPPMPRKPRNVFPYYGGI